MSELNRQASIYEATTIKRSSVDKTTKQKDIGLT